MTKPVARRFGSLWVRVSILGVAIAIVTGVIAGVLATGLIRSSEDASARVLLGRIADAAAQSAPRRPSASPRLLKRRVLKVLDVQFGQLGPAGRTIVTDSSEVADSLDAAEIAALRNGTSLSATRTVDGERVYVEARPIPGGGIVLVQPSGPATAGGNDAIRRSLLAILIGVAVAALLCVLVARWIAAPLRRAAQAARALAQGRRDVALVPSGPAEVVEVADAVNTLTTALATSEGRHREFLMSVSHDLRTPLTAIRGYAESLADDVVPAEDTAHVGTVMLGEAKRLERLVADLLDLARLDARDLRVELADVDLADLVRSAAPVWERRCADAGVLFRASASGAPARTDAARVRQIVDGLMENALRVTPAGAPIVLSSGIDPDGRASLEVRDGGPGLRDDELDIAFERSALYERYRGVRQVGTGLGLAIVARLADRLGGTVEAGHALEGGARFSVRLPPAQPFPRSSALPSESPAASSRPAGPAAGVSGSRAR